MSVNVQKVLWTMQELGIACERTDLGGHFADWGRGECVVMNPNQRVPTRVDGELVL